MSRVSFSLLAYRVFLFSLVAYFVFYSAWWLTVYFIQPVGLLLYGHSKVVRMLVQPVGLLNDLFCR